MRLGAFIAGLRLPWLTHIVETGLRWDRLRVVIAIAGGAVVTLAARAWGALPEGGVDPGILATVRTVVMALSALVLASMGRRERFAEWGWLVYPVLAVTGLKIILEDFSRSRPATLFLALAAYGCALLFSPRLRRSTAASGK
jgi:hypothetical protein